MSYPQFIFIIHRYKTYDDDQVLEKAMHVFWAHEYEATSVRLLEKEMGINQFSIYALLKNKEIWLSMPYENTGSLSLKTGINPAYRKMLSKK